MAAMSQALALTYSDYEEKLDRSFGEKRRWDLPFKRTIRQNLSEVPAGRVRDTKDLGELVRGRKRVLGKRLEIGTSYGDVHYSWKVFKGFRVGRTIIPARPLPNIVAGEMDWAKTFKKNWKG
jgi:hypothetical protein